MSLIYRRLTYWFFIAVFLIAAPLIVLYTEGYRYNFDRGRVQKTGIIVVSSVPRRAEIWLNGVKQQNTTPTRLEQTLPGDYEIRLAKEGFHDWSKKLPVVENGTTFAEKILLFKNSWPGQLSTTTLITWLASPDEKKIAGLQNDRAIILYDLANKKNWTLQQFQNASDLNLVAWSPDSNKALLRSGQKYFVWEPSAKKPLTSIDSNYYSVKWDARNSNWLYALSTTGIWRYDLTTDRAALAWSGKFNDFMPVLEGLYFTTGKQILYHRFTDSRLPIAAGELSCATCLLTARLGDKIILHDKKEQKLLIIDTTNKTAPVSYSAKDFNWLDDTTILFYNDWEVWLFDSSKKEAELITRLGQPIEGAVWHHDGKHIIFASGGKISVIELDNRELRNLIDLADATQVPGLTLDSKDKNLYFGGTVGDQTGIWELSIQD